MKDSAAFSSEQDFGLPGSKKVGMSDLSDEICVFLCFCQDEISALRRRLEKSEKERNELRQTADNLETKVWN